MIPSGSAALARIQPIPSTSGISVRKFPLPTFESLRTICHHYELKTSGIVCPKCRASRNLFDMSREIQDQLLPLIEEEKRRNQRLEMLSTTLHDWEMYFGLPINTSIDSPSMAPHLQLLRAEVSPILTPKIIYDELKRVVDLNQKLEDVIQAHAEFAQEEESALEREYHALKRERLGSASTLLHEMKNELDEERKKDRLRMKEELNLIRSSCENTIKEMQNEMEELKNTFEEELEKEQSERNSIVQNIKAAIKEWKTKGVSQEVGIQTLERYG
eukprot:MONOS_3495.1-p1 / transcript=MONOS_3495.1 / gene=MONOS_3495 / organism=Monocercomonoides_exilis_PA203 / gene_product=unspecified product / transcript_product=unspecified product / location=Mono_scaffold00083:2261-3581(-) / protein_length=273 / sequence_SO=supercontig / SO=protein_coding / is_pseudo=false